MAKGKGRLVKAFIGHTGPELAAQEVLYGFVMALIFITSAQVGLIGYSSPWDVIIMVLGMNFVWGFIDMYIFYRMDATAQKRYIKILNDKDMDPEKRYQEAYGALDGTILDAVCEDCKSEVARRILDAEVAKESNLKADRVKMLKSAASCFIITLMTTIPLILCMALIPGEDGLEAAIVVACALLFIVGYKLEPGDSVKNRVMTGASIALVSFGLTYFAMYLGG